MQKLDMVSKGKLLILVLSVIAVVSLAIVYVHEFNPFNAAVKGNYKPGLSTEIDTMVGRAQIQIRKNVGARKSAIRFLAR
jgi:hypothetical protein